MCSSLSSNFWCFCCSCQPDLPGLKKSSIGWCTDVVKWCLVYPLFPYFSVHHWLPRYSHLTRVSIWYSVHIPRVLQGTSKRSKLSWMLYWHISSVQESLHKCGVAPLLTRCHFTVPSNHESQGLRGVTTVCLVYNQETSKQVQGLELQPCAQLCSGVKQGLANFKPKTCLGALLSTKQGFWTVLSQNCLVLSKPSGQC